MQESKIKINGRSRTRKMNKGLENEQLSLFMGNMIVYIESLKESTDKPDTTRSCKLIYKYHKDLSSI